MATTSRHPDSDEIRRHAGSFPGRLIAITATGPIYEVPTTYNVIPTSCALAVLQELAARTLDRDASVVSSAAQRVHGGEALGAWQIRTLSYACSLSASPAHARLGFLREVIEYVRRERNAEGLEAVLASAINGAWPWVPQSELGPTLELAHSMIKQSVFVDKVGCLIVDPNTRSIQLLNSERLKAHDPNEWFKWRYSPDEWRLGLAKTPGGAAASWIGNVANSLGFDGEQNDGSNPFEAGTWAVGTPAPGKGPIGIGRLPGGLGVPAGTGPGGLVGRDDAGSTNPFGAGSPFFGGAGVSGEVPGFGARGTGRNAPGQRRGGPLGSGGPWVGMNGLSPGGIGGGMGGSVGNSIPGSFGGGAGPLGTVGESSNPMIGPYGAIGPGQAGGPTGFGAQLGPGGAELSGSDVERWFAVNMIGAGFITVVVGGVAAGTGAGIPAGAALGGIGAAEIAIGGLLLTDANRRDDREIHEKERAEDKAEKEAEKAAKKDKSDEKKGEKKEEKKDEKKEDKAINVHELPNAGSKKGDKYADPHGKGGSLPADDGTGGGRPNTMPDRDGVGGGRPEMLPDHDDIGGGRPNALPDFEGFGGGNPNTIWDEYGGGVTPTTTGILASGVTFEGQGLRAVVFQVAGDTFRY
ncbi:UNVERIFIED_ORG: hypothetical protein BDU10_7483 [Burkholderia sp. CF145]